jgi:hypothetical protein
MTQQRLEAYITALGDLTAEQFSIACNRAVKELKWFPKVAELRDFALSSRQQRDEAEGMAAWITATEFADKWVQADAYGNYVPSRGVRSSPIPLLDNRISTAVKACRGWKAFKCRTPENEAFLRKEFLAAFRNSTLIAETPKLALPGQEPKSLPGEIQPAHPVVNPFRDVVRPPVKPMPQTTDFDARREELKKQAAKFQEKQA